MEIPIHKSLDDFKENYLIDFQQFEGITFLQYLQQCRSVYNQKVVKIKNEKYKDFINSLQIRKRSILAQLSENLSVDELQKLNEIKFQNIYFGSHNSEVTINKIRGLIPFEITEINESALIELVTIWKELKYTEKTKNLLISFIEPIVSFINSEIRNEEIHYLKHPTNNEIPIVPEPEPYEKETGRKNIPYKLALLRELGILERLNIQFSDNKEQLYRILDYLTGGNTKGYYLSMYGENYQGKDRVTKAHNADLRQKGLI